MANILNHEGLGRILRGLKPEDVKQMIEILVELSNSNFGLLLQANDFSNVRYLQGYISAILDLLSLLTKERR